MARLGDLRAKLTDKEAQFCHYYTETWEKRESGIKAGYSEVSAASIVSEILRKKSVKNYIAALLEIKRKEHAPTIERLRLEVQDIAFSKVTDFYKHISDGKGYINDIDMEQLDKLPNSIKACIKEIQPTKYGYRVLFYNKVAALEMLAKHLGFYEQDNLQKTSTGIGIYLPDNGRPMPPDPDNEVSGEGAKR